MKNILKVVIMSVVVFYTIFCCTITTLADGFELVIEREPKNESNIGKGNAILKGYLDAENLIKPSSLSIPLDRYTPHIEPRIKLVVYTEQMENLDAIGNEHCGSVSIEDIINNDNRTEMEMKKEKSEKSAMLGLTTLAIISIGLSIISIILIIVRMIKH